MCKIDAYTIEKIYSQLIMSAAQEITVSGKPFLISNNGTRPLYINVGTTCTALNGLLIPAGTTIPVPLTCDKLSVISDSTGTYAVLMYLR